MRVLIVVGLLVVSTPAVAQVQGLKPAAKAKLDRGLRLAADKKFDDAVREFRAGYVMSEAREFLYAMGQVERIRGNCRAALLHYHAFVDTAPPADQTAAARVQIDRCEADLASAEAKVDAARAPKKDPPSEPAPTPAVTSSDTGAATSSETKATPMVAAQPPTAVAAPLVVRQPLPPWYQDALGTVLGASGVVVVAGGATVFILGNLAARGSKRNLDTFTDATSSTWAQPAGIAIASAGGALIIGSLIRYATRSSGTASAPTIGVAATDQGGMFVIGGGF